MITVLVCTRGRSDLLAGCVASIAADLGPDDELLVVAHGDGSTAALAAPLRSRARILEAPRGGKSRQLNQGLRCASSDIVVLTDDDCQVEPGWLVAMAAPFADPLVGAAFGAVSGLSSVRDRPQQPVPPGPAPEVTWDYANGAAMAVRRSAAYDIGGFDERLGPGAPVHGEEHDLVLRLQEAGWGVRVAGAPAVHHLGWRSEAETRQNLLTYSAGAGAFLGTALRRSPRRSARLAARRVRYQASLWRHHRVEGRWFGPATTVAFVRGLARGVLLRPRRFL